MSGDQITLGTLRICFEQLSAQAFGMPYILVRQQCEGETNRVVGRCRSKEECLIERINRARPLPESAKESTQSDPRVAAKRRDLDRAPQHQLCFAKVSARGVQLCQLVIERDIERIGLDSPDQRSY